ncbi:uncharacterized protein MONOS_16605 [Monocercomonoides exilis]|uniref:uncharacterized protein n=1 Tax=Monocercomonoides exilis TaxID=2049356 RepID=UPI0035599075|nr:hypothetical protein MONOS_16605 [Monocercomonoides exilis]|eukprot:MONOS_16605.1-p1 / transcript=MONOS_16605.1 / gene=MONOS_16605 / organism=Monocercomonoides_exilis_PA203 / gene_product=unspecified product / transcript_product=unspecified product / location=Mono_scaffold01915:1575-2205(+) / protein_length=91 / sequence_SO=supercontig / SO=protein_coding / is_pseudo=false
MDVRRMDWDEDSLDAPLICGARDGGGGGGRREEGTSALALCIGGVKTEEDEELIMGVVSQWKEAKYWRYLFFYDRVIWGCCKKWDQNSGR